MAQTEQQVADTIAFRTYLSQGTLADYIQASTLVTIYHGLERNEIPSHNGRSYGFCWPDSYYREYTQITSPTLPSRFVQNDDGEFARARFYNESEMQKMGDGRSALRSLCYQVRTYRSSYKDKKAEKQDLVHALMAFDSASVDKPFFFTDIKNRFKGDFHKYVDYIYRRSFLTSNRRLRRFTYYANIVDFRADMGVRFVLGLALYELRIRDMRKASATDGVPCSTDGKASR